MCVVTWRIYNDSHMLSDMHMNRNLPVRYFEYKYNFFVLKSADNILVKLFSLKKAFYFSLCKYKESLNNLYKYSQEKYCQKIYFKRNFEVFKYWNKSF